MNWFNLILHNSKRICSQWTAYLWEQPTVHEPSALKTLQPIRFNNRLTHQQKKETIMSHPKPKAQREQSQDHRITIHEDEEEEEMPQANKKTYSNHPVATEETKCQFIWKVTFFVLTIAVLITLAILATGDRPLAKAIRNSMNKEFDVYSWFQTSNNTNGTDVFGETTTTQYPVETYTMESWTTASPTPWTKKPSASEVTPSAILETNRFVYEFYKHPWMLETARSICQRRQSNLIYIENEAENNQTRDWIRFNVTDKLPYSRAGLYWTAGRSVNSNPLNEKSYTFNWDGVSGVPTTYRNFCFNHTEGLNQEYWDKNPSKRTLTIVLNFNRDHVADPSMGCWGISFPLNENDLLDKDGKGKEHLDLAGNPFICKRAKWNNNCVVNFEVYCRIIWKLLNNRKHVCNVMWFGVIYKRFHRNSYSAYLLIYNLKRKN